MMYNNNNAYAYTCMNVLQSMHALTVNLYAALTDLAHSVYAHIHTYLFLCAWPFVSLLAEFKHSVAPE
jgi:hypothetical protein